MTCGALFGSASKPMWIGERRADKSRNSIWDQKLIFYHTSMVLSHLPNPLALGPYPASLFVPIIYSPMMQCVRLWIWWWQIIVIVVLYDGVVRLRFCTPSSDPSYKSAGSRNSIRVLSRSFFVFVPPISSSESYVVAPEELNFLSGLYETPIRMLASGLTISSFR